MNFPYDKAYGLPDETRAAILYDAEHMSVKEAALYHQVHVSTIYRWRKDVKAVSAQHNQE